MNIYPMQFLGIFIIFLILYRAFYKAVCNDSNHSIYLNRLSERKGSLCRYKVSTIMEKHVLSIILAMVPTVLLIGVIVMYNGFWKDIGLL